MISIIVVLYNSGIFLEKFLRTLKQALSATKLYELIIFDNNSDDRSLEKAKILANALKIPNVKFVQSQKNLGFTNATNNAIRLSKYEDILLINPHSYLYKDSIKTIWEYYKSHPNAIIGGQLRDYSKNRVLRSVVKSVSFKDCILQLTNIRKLRIFEAYNFFWNKDDRAVQSVAAISAAFMLFSRKIYNLLGGFDKKFWMYLEDVDFCVRAKKLGYKIYYYPKAKIKHFGGGSSRSNRNKINVREWFKSRDVFFKKNFNSIQYLVYFIVSRIELTILKLLNKL